ncbi:MAG TPA: hypothetical protein VGV86_04560 [Acidimicrobiales bacterium]|nr:hypothetical protein [Acidimicrobiales bacterium]
MPDPRLEALTGMVARVEGAACWLARLATKAAVIGGAAGVALWWVIAGSRVDEWWRGTVGSVLVLLLCVAAPAWLLNVRSALHDLVELPEKLTGVTTRRVAELRGGARPERPDGGALQAMRSVRGVLRDYGDVVGSWGTVAQLLVPSFWLLTAVALVAVPILVVLAAVAGLVDFYA